MEQTSLPTSLTRHTLPLGHRNAGDGVLPVRMVVTPDGDIVNRCVALRAGGYACDAEWPMFFSSGSLGNGAVEQQITAMIDHMARYHTVTKVSG